MAKKQSQEDYTLPTEPEPDEPGGESPPVPTSGSDDLTTLDYFAIHAPRPTSQEVAMRVNRKRRAAGLRPGTNPTSESLADVEAELRYEFAIAMMRVRMQYQ